MPTGGHLSTGLDSTSRWVALSSSAAFGILCAALASVRAIPWFEAAWAAVAVLTIFVPAGWWAPVGWRRRLAEAVLVLPAWALILLVDPVQRRMLAPPLLAAAACAALVAAWSKVAERHRLRLIVLLALSARASAGMGLVGWEAWRVGLALLASGAVAWAAARLGGRDLGISGALLSACVPFQALPVAAGVAIFVAVLAGAFGDSTVNRTVGRGWIPGAVGAALVWLSLAPWGNLELTSQFPSAGGWVVLAVTVAVVVSGLLPAGAAGVVWMAVAWTVGSAVAPTPDRGGLEVTDGSAGVLLPAGTGALYILDVRLDGDRDLAVGTPVAVVTVNGSSRALFYPDHATHRSGALQTNNLAVWRPERVGKRGAWRVAIRSVVEVPNGVKPRIARHADLPVGVRVALETAGPAIPIPPRDRAAVWWLTAAALVVAALQLASGTWRQAFAVVPWTILVSGSLMVRVWVEPLRLLAERHGPDLALAALLTAWFPAACVWLGQRRVAAAVTALLLPLALATPHLTPPLYGDEPFHLAVMESIVADGDLDLRNNIDVSAHPQAAIFQKNGDLLHSPVLGFLLLPGYAIAGRSGALVLLAIAGALTVTLLTRRMRRLGVPESRLGGMVVILAVTYPVAVFVSQIWPEMPGALAVATILVLAAGVRGGRWTAAGLALLASAVKLRLALLTFPAALAAWWPDRRGRMVGVAVLATAAIASLAIGWLTMGHPFGIYRRVHHLIPSDPGLAVRAVGGLIFDPSGGLLFSAPLWLVALAGLVALWRRGGAAERAVLVGCVITVAALLHSIEWYGGGSPPARYLVPMLPAVALAGGMLLRTPLPGRRLASVLVLPSVALWWVLVTRPHFSINPGNGGWWATDALARSHQVDTAWLVPSFLVPRTATLLFPLLIIVLTAVLVFASRRWPSIARYLGSASVAVWLSIASVVVVAIELRTDRVVEIEAPQVRRHGGSLYPREGTFSRFMHRGGWIVRDGDRVTIPLNLTEGASLWLDGWLVGPARRGSQLELRWDDGEPVTLSVRGYARNARVAIPRVPGPGRHKLSIAFRAPPKGAAMLDRVSVQTGE